MNKYIIAIDQGTSSSRVMIFDTRGVAMSLVQQAIKQYYPEPGWVEHDPIEIWQTTLALCKKAIAKAKVRVSDIHALGITNQRETTIIWERATGKPIHPAIVWQDRRTAAYCQKLIDAGHEKHFQAKTGLRLDPYFSGTKIQWLLDNIPGARVAAEVGALAFGTIDSFLLWHLTDGRVHATDATNASRTLLYDIHTNTWDEDLLALLAIPRALLPEVKSCNATFATTDKSLFGYEIPITGVAGDQQAAMVGQGCISPSMTKSTYGSGAFMMVNTGDKCVMSKHHLLTTLAYYINGVPTYAVEGSIFNAGTVVAWLKENVGLLTSADESETLAASEMNSGGVVFVPAFTGLGAPFWDPHARGAILGITRDTTKAQIVRAALDSITFQTLDLLFAMRDDGVDAFCALKVDGAMISNNWFCQQLADRLQLTIQRAKTHEVTTLGAAFIAALGAGMVNDLGDITTWWQCEKSFEPLVANMARDTAYERWQLAVSLVRSFAEQSQH